LTRSLDNKRAWDNISERPVMIWVLSPLLETHDENIEYYYDFTQSIEEYKKVFSHLGLEWKWQPVTITSYKKIIAEIGQALRTGKYFPIVLNLCDGDEVNGTPGISVIKSLKEEGLIFSGADEYFYRITTSKIPMKNCFDLHGIPNAQWTIIDEKYDAENIFNTVAPPVIVKPAVSGGSMGVGVRNVVEHIDDLNHLIDSLKEGYRGWDLMVDGLIAEKFIAGREFTVLICGNYNNPDRIHVYPPVERVFHSSLPEKEKFLSFDRLWETYETEEAMPENGNFYDYESVDEALGFDICQITKNAFIATGGSGYARADLRMDNESGKLYMLEINAQCGISEDENFTSIGAILRFAGITFSDLIKEILEFAVENNSLRKLSEFQQKINR